MHVVIHTARAERAIAFDPMLAAPEAYMDGELDIVEGDMLGLLRIVFQNMGPRRRRAVWTKAIEGVRNAFRRLQQVNTASRAKRNVAAPLRPVGRTLPALPRRRHAVFLRLFRAPRHDARGGADAKKRHIAAKLQMKPGQTVLDIGSGWGGLGLYLAKTFEADVLGVTLSTEQHAVATERAQAERLDNHVHFEIRDYRDLSERFDRIVSVGMFEHVGINHYRTFFDKCATLLKPDGVMLLHTIGRSGPPAATSAFIRKYIFPGGYIPALSEVMPAIEKIGPDGHRHRDPAAALCRDAEALARALPGQPGRAKAIYDERFCRMWEFYLAGSEAAFRWQDLVVFQIQLTRKNDTLPITRGYIEKCEKALALHERATVPEQKKAPAPTRRRKVAK